MYFSCSWSGSNFSICLLLSRLVSRFQGACSSWRKTRRNFEETMHSKGLLQVWQESRDCHYQLFLKLPYMSTTIWYSYHGYLGATLDQTILHSPLELVAIHAVPRFTTAAEKRKTSEILRKTTWHDLASHHIMMSAPFVTLSEVAMCECQIRCQRKDTKMRQRGTWQGWYAKQSSWSTQVANHEEQSSHSSQVPTRSHEIPWASPFRTLAQYLESSLVNSSQTDPMSSCFIP